MKIKVSLKSVSKTRGIVEVDYIVSDSIITLQDLIINLVDIEIDKYNNQALSVQSQDQINAMVNHGKISFGFKYNDCEVNRDDAIDNALVSFKDGIYRLFINDMEITSIDQELNLIEGDRLSLIRLTMMTGWFSS